MKKFVTIILISLANLIGLQAQDQGITSEVHRKNVNKIVFAKNKSDLTFRRENPSNFKTSFTSSDNIYGRVYVDKSIKNKTKQYGPGILMYDLFIDGNRISHKKSFGMYKHLQDKTYYTEQIDVGNSFNKWTSWKIWLLPTLNDDELKYGNCNIASRAFTLALLEQKPGNHQIKINVYYTDMTGDFKSKTLASGEFTIEIKATDKKKLAFAYAPPLPKDEYSGTNKKETIAAIKEAFIQQLGKSPIICGIYKRGWREGSYRLTGQKFKKIAGWAVFEDSDGDGQVPVTTFNFISDYTNDGWTKLRFDSHCLGCADWDVEVEAVKAIANIK